MNRSGTRKKNRIYRIAKYFINIIYRNNINKIKYIGDETEIKKDCYFEHPEKITIGNKCSINNQCWIIAATNIKIGNNVLIAPRVAFFTVNHNYKKRNKLINKQGYKYKEIIVEDDVWIGYGVTVLYGVKIGKGAVIGTGAVVTKDVEPYSIVVGIPAKKVGIRDE